MATTTSAVVRGSEIIVKDRPAFRRSDYCPTNRSTYVPEGHMHTHFDSRRSPPRQSREHGAAVQIDSRGDRHQTRDKHRAGAGVFRRTGQRMIVRLDEIDDMLEARVEQFGCEDETDRGGQHEPMDRIETKQRCERDRDDGESELPAEIRLVDERLPDPVDRIGERVRETPFNDDRPPL